MTRTITVTLTVRQMDDLRLSLDSHLSELEARYQRLQLKGLGQGTRAFADRLHAIDAILRGHPNHELKAK